jgi:hypothetical protein
MDLWGKSGVISATRGKRGEARKKGYMNLAKRCSNEANFNQKVHWHKVDNSDNSFSYIRHEAWSFNGNRCTTEVKINGNEREHEIEISIQGFKFALEEIHAQELLNSLPLSAKVQVITDFLDSCAICSGIPVQTGETILPSAAMKEFEVTNTETIRTYFAEHCKGIAPEGQCCSICSSAKRNLTKKEKRKDAKGEKQRKFCNERYFSREDLKNKSEMLNKRYKAIKIRDIRMKEKFEKELYKMEVEDHNDLKWIMDNNCSANVHEDMQSLWEQQKKISETPSKRGYRWHPK